MFPDSRDFPTFLVRRSEYGAVCPACREPKKSWPRSCDLRRHASHEDFAAHRHRNGNWDGRLGRTRRGGSGCSAETSIDLTRQVVLITGGSRGLGLAVAQEFGKRRCRLAICARNEEELNRARARLEAAGREVLT